MHGSHRMHSLLVLEFTRNYFSSARIWVHIWVHILLLIEKDTYFLLGILVFFGA